MEKKVMEPSEVQESSKPYYKYGFWMLMFVLAVVLFFMNKCNGDHKANENALKSIITSQKSEIDLLKKDRDLLLKAADKYIGLYFLKSQECDSLRKEIGKLKTANNLIKKENDGLKARIAELENRKVALDSVETTNEDGKKGIMVTGRIVPANFPGMPKLFVAYPCVNDSVKKEVNIVKNYSIQLFKYIYSRKGEKIQTSVIGNYSSLLAFSTLSGFPKDSLIWNYKYRNERNDTSVLSFESRISGNSLLMNMNHNGDILMSQEKKFFQLGTSELNHNFESEKYWEKIVNPYRMRKGNLEILEGFVIAGTGFYGRWYFNNHPIAVVNITNNGNSIFQRNIYNKFGIGVSDAAIGLGTALAIKGVIDRRLSWYLSPVSFGVNVKLY